MRSASLVVLIGLTATIACHKQAPVVQAPAPAPAPTEDLAARARADSIRAAEQARADSLAMAMKAEADRQEAARVARLQAALRDTLAQRTHFDFDRADIRPGDRQLLDRKLAILQSNPSLRLRIAGNADERGSDEYNLALGSRRAAVARSYLVNHGIAPERLEVVSYGEERPLAAGHDEAAWALNRRDDFAPLTGGALIAPIAIR